jgi:hypothetical protein
MKEWYDSSSLNLFMECPRKYYYRHVLNLVPRNYISPDLSFGGAIHSALETIYNGTWDDRVECPHRTADDDPDKCPFCRDRLTRRMYRVFIEKFPVTHEKPPNKTQLTGAQLLLAYVKRWLEKDSKEFKIGAIEQPFKQEFMVDDIATDFMGRIDLLVDWLDMGWFIIDHKTMRDLNFDKYALDFAVSGYSRVLHKPTQQGAKGVMINALQPKPKVDEKSFQRHIEQREDWMLSEWEEDYQQVVREIRLAHMTKNWRKNTQSCYAWFRECEYIRLCLTSGGEKRQKEIDLHYVEEQWIPF